MAAVAKRSCGSIGHRPTRFRAAAVLAATAAVSWIAPPSSAPAADVDLTPTVLKGRAAVGLPPVRADAAVRAAAGALLGGQDAQAAFTSAGGTGSLVTARVPAGSALAAAQVKSAVFDPRATSLAVLRRDRTVAVAAALDPRRPFRAPVLAGAVADPGVAGSLAVLFPPGGGTIPAISLQQNRSGDLVTIEVAATAVPGAQGRSCCSSRDATGSRGAPARLRPRLHAQDRHPVVPCEDQPGADRAHVEVVRERAGLHRRRPTGLREGGEPTPVPGPADRRRHRRRDHGARPRQLDPELRRADVLRGLRSRQRVLPDRQPLAAAQPRGAGS